MKGTRTSHYITFTSHYTTLYHITSHVTAQVKGDSYKIDPIPLTHVRPFVVGEIALAEVIASSSGKDIYIYIAS